MGWIIIINCLKKYARSTSYDYYQHSTTELWRQNIWEGERDLPEEMNQKRDDRESQRRNQRMASIFFYDKDQI